MTVTRVEPLTKTKFRIYIDEHPAFVLYQGEVKAKKTVRGGDEWYQIASFTESIEWSPDELIEDWENVVLHAVMTDAKGNAYTKDEPINSPHGNPRSVDVEVPKTPANRSVRRRYAA